MPGERLSEGDAGLVLTTVGILAGVLLSVWLFMDARRGFDVLGRSVNYIRLSVDRVERAQREEREKGVAIKSMLERLLRRWGGRP